MHLLAPAFSSLMACSVQVDHGNTLYSCEEDPVCPPGAACVQGVCRFTDAGPLDGSGDGNPIQENTLILSGDEEDAEEAIGDGTMDLASSDLELGDDNGVDQIVALRYQIPFPPGTIINNAYIQFTSDIEASDPAAYNINIQSVDDALAFDTDSGNISSRQFSGGALDWSPPAWSVDEAGEGQRTPNLASLLGPILARPGFVAGNSVVFVFRGNGLRRGYSFNGDASKSPTLFVEFVRP